MKKSEETDPGSTFFFFIHFILSLKTYHGCDWQRTKKQENIRLNYVSLYINFVSLLTSVKKEISRSTRPKFLEHSVSPRLFCSSGALSW